ncbi:MAG: flagella basal body P-ring formation protein FlgA [Novosphingobium sp.]
MIRMIAFTAALGAASPACAQGYADLGEVDRAVAQFTGAPIGAQGGAAQGVDRRLRLAPCPQVLTLGWYGPGRSTVEVRCPVQGGWKLYVPLASGSGTGGMGQGAEQPAVFKGDAVTISVTGEGFAVSQGGEALESGPVGAWIKVRGLAADAPVLRAQVLRPGLVGMLLP